MSLIYADAQRKRLIPDDVKYNPVRPPELGGARCKCVSDYTVVILTPKQTFAILNSLPLLQQTMVVLDAATGLRYSEIAGLKWQDVDWENSQIHIRRRWIRATSANRSQRDRRLRLRWPRCWRSIFALGRRKPLTQKRRIGFSLPIKPTDARPASATCCASIIFVRPLSRRGWSWRRASGRVPQPAPQPGIVPRHQEEDRRQTVQRSMRHAKSTTMLDYYAQTDMDELIAAQEMMLDAIFSHAEGTVQ